MRLNKKRFKTYKLYGRITKKNDEGVVISSYDENYKEIQAEIWPASGRIQSEIYGEKVNYMLNMIVDRTTDIKERDGLCIDCEKVDYKVVSIKNYTLHKLIELEKI